SVTFACDYDSKEIPSGEHLTRAFSLDGRDYEIDLCERHSQKFDEVMKRFAEKARKVSTKVGRTKRRTTAHRRRSAEIRAWAKRRGRKVSEGAGTPRRFITKYEANHWLLVSAAGGGRGMPRGRPPAPEARPVRLRDQVVGLRGVLQAVGAHRADGCGEHLRV